MPSDYQKIRADHTRRYGTDVGNYGRDFADRYTERTHCIFELLQNAEDALRWRRRAEPRHNYPHTVRFRLFPDRLEVSHFGLPFGEEHVRAICSIKRGTKANSLTDIGKFGIGFKSVFTYTNRPEVHSGDEHFAIVDYVHPEATPAREARPCETLFCLPFDVAEVNPTQAHAEIGARLNELGFRTLLFLSEIESVEWEVIGGNSGTYTRRAKFDRRWKEVTLMGRGPTRSPTIERWLVFSRNVVNRDQEIAGEVEIAFLLRRGSKFPVITRAEGSNLFVFFPTEKETHCGFMIQGPYKTTPGRDNIPHDDPWNAYIVEETATLMRESLIRLERSGLSSRGLLQALPLFQSSNKPDKWMFEPIYDTIVRTLIAEPLIPAANGRFVAARQARIARDRGMVELLHPEQLTELLDSGSEEQLRWVTPEISDPRSGDPVICAFLQEVMKVPSLDSLRLVQHFTEQFFAHQSDRWMVRFYRFLLEHERLWRLGVPRGPLLQQNFIRVTPERHVAPFDSHGKANVYLPGDGPSDYECVHAPLLASKAGAEFFRKLGLTKPDITAEVLHKIVPQYESDTIALNENEHTENLKKIVRAMASDSPHQPELMRQLQGVYFLQIKETGKKGTYYARPGNVYFATPTLQTYFSGEKGIYFLHHLDDTLIPEKVIGLLKQLGVADEPRRYKVRRDTDSELRKALRDGGGATTELFANYGLDGLKNFIRGQRKATGAEATRRARILWDFLVRGYENGQRTGTGYFRGSYEWKYYSSHKKTFDAHFLEVLRSKAWLPGRDGRPHRPSELLPRELPSGFPRNQGVCEALQMKADVMVELARKAGVRLEDLAFIRDHRDEFDTFKRGVKGRKVPEATTASDDPPLPKDGRSAGYGDTIANRKVEPRYASNGSGRPEAGNVRDSSSDSGSANADPSQEGTYATYLYVSGNGSSAELHAQNCERSEERKAVGSLGVDAALAFEQTAGRQPARMPPTHEGYDIKSCDTSGRIERYIEVKTIRTEWGERGVTLTSAQFEAAREHKGLYWLYVVENPGAQNQRIFRVWNPGQMAQWYVFDHGWRQLTEPDDLETGSNRSSTA